MASSKLEDCLTCLRRTERFVEITEADDEGGENVETVLGKHFWFTKEEYTDRVVCSSCWEKIDDFHKFYCQVKRVYRPRLKTEPGRGSDDESNLSDNEANGYETYHADVCKTEIEDVVVESLKLEEMCSTDDDQGKGMEENSDSESNVALKKRMRARKSRKAVKLGNLKKYDGEKYDCNLCCKDADVESVSFNSWCSLKNHFENVHGSKGYVKCCGRKYVGPKTYLRHAGSHKKPSKKQRFCKECNHTFTSEKSYAEHMLIVHTPDEDKPYKCHLCTKAFLEEDLLSSHIKWHEEVEKLNHHCALCNRFFYDSGNLERHNATHHGSDPTAAITVENNTSNVQEKLSENRATPEEQEELIRQYVALNCSQCGYAGKSFSNLARHATAAHQIKTYAVVCCEKRFNQRFRLYEHCLRHLNPDCFKCEACGKAFRDSSGLQHHTWSIHTPASERPFKCDICGDAFMKNYLLKYHLDRHLDKERKKHTCEDCGNAYTSMLQLKSHQQRVHGAVSDWVCDICAKGFAHRSLLEQHRITHTEEGLASLKMQCETCHKWLTNKRNYLRHRQRCGNNRGPAQCDLCSHVSVNEKALLRHKQLNHGDVRKYACSYCGKEFKKQLRLKEHEANHAGIILYQCPFCPRMCNSSSNMYTHKKVAHPEEWAEMLAAKNSN